MKELSLDTHVVICRQMGTYHVTQEMARNLRGLIDSTNPPKSIYLEKYDAQIAMSDIVGVVTAQRYDEIRKERKGQWKCQYDIWHDRDEKCRCSWGKAPRKQGSPMPEEMHVHISPEQAEKNRIILDLVRAKKATFSDMKNLKSKSTSELREMLKSV